MQKRNSKRASKQHTVRDGCVRPTDQASIEAEDDAGVFVLVFRRHFAGGKNETSSLESHPDNPQTKKLKLQNERR